MAQARGLDGGAAIWAAASRSGLNHDTLDRHAAPGELRTVEIQD